MALFEEVRKVDNEPELHKLHRLEREWKKWHIYPSSRPIIGGSDEKYENERENPHNKYMLCVSLKKRIRCFYDKGKKQKAQENMGDVFQQIEVIIRLCEQSLGNHEGRYLKGRIDTYGTNHNHSKHH